MYKWCLVSLNLVLAFLILLDLLLNLENMFIQIDEWMVAMKIIVAFMLYVIPKYCLETKLYFYRWSKFCKT